MKYQELRDLVKNWKKHKGCINKERSPLINPGFLGTFNLSFTEDFWLKEYGRFVDFDHDLIFSTIQSCIRPQDIMLTNTKDSWKYLGVFEMADLNGFLTLAKRPDFDKLQKQQIKELMKFLKHLGFSPNQIYPSYNIGGKVRDITKGKYNFDFTIPEDKISKQGFLEAGIPEKNLIKDKTRNTLLALHIYRPSPWGYRNEININIGPDEKPLLLDIATIEYTIWKPEFKGDNSIASNIIGLKNSGDGFSIVAVGLERLNVIINKLKIIQDVDYVKPIYEKWKEIISKENILTIESLRALHRIYSDITSYKLIPGWHQNKKIKHLLQNIPKDVSLEKIESLLLVHAKNQPWHKNLKQGINPTIERINKYRNSKK
ncbi:hypothetical protein HYT23_00680 [Candidatus Pacearchaeota archaeon]|nr:hypothetical protein [Candidatus Pacearchaeota archaeon]